MAQSGQLAVEQAALSKAQPKSAKKTILAEVRGVGFLSPVAAVA